MQAHLTNLAMLMLAALAGCEKSTTSSTASTGSDDTKAFVGTWSCTSQITYKFTSPPNTPDKQATLELTRTITGSGKTLESTSVTATGVSSGCVTKWTVDGTTATADPDQTCTAKVTTSDGAQREVTTRHTRATANLTGGAIHEIASADVDIVQGAIHLVGTATAAATCTRKP